MATTAELLQARSDLEAVIEANKRARDALEHQEAALKETNRTLERLATVLTERLAKRSR